MSVHDQRLIQDAQRRATTALKSLAVELQRVQEAAAGGAIEDREPGEDEDDGLDELLKTYAELERAIAVGQLEEAEGLAEALAEHEALPRSLDPLASRLCLEVRELVECVFATTQNEDGEP